MAISQKNRWIRISDFQGAVSDSGFGFHFFSQHTYLKFKTGFISNLYCPGIITIINVDKKPEITFLLVDKGSILKTLKKIE